MTAWITLFSHSPKAKLAWRARRAIAVKTFSKTGWWSHWEIVNQLLELFGDIHPFLQVHSDLGPATRTKMLSILQDPTKRILLQLQIAIVVDAGKQFVQATYNLEENGALVLQCYKQIEAILNFIRVHHFPNTDAVIRKFCIGQPSHIPLHWKQHAESCVQPGFDYFCSSKIILTTHDW